MNLKNIESLDSVKEFALQLKLELGLGFHCDDNFEDYIYFDNGRSIYTEEQVAIRNKLIKQAFEICEQAKVDIYSFMGRITVKDTPFENVFD